MPTFTWNRSRGEDEIKASGLISRRMPIIPDEHTESQLYTSDKDAHWLFLRRISARQKPFSNESYRYSLHNIGWICTANLFLPFWRCNQPWWLSITVDKVLDCAKLKCLYVKVLSRWNGRLRRLSQCFCVFFLLEYWVHVLISSPCFFILYVLDFALNGIHVLLPRKGVYLLITIFILFLLAVLGEPSLYPRPPNLNYSHFTTNFLFLIALQV